ncbi:MAG: zf-HC2 domain-containing protein [Clostridia bacterium]|nr:zf-HC2 domain-containing protein [Clostridia bacterium]
MKTDCEIIRDLLPLYVDDICSEKSRELVDEHLRECTECGSLLDRLKRTEIENGLKAEKEDAISYGVRKFKQLSARTGITASGLFMIPLLVLLAINLLAGSQLGWFLIMVAALIVAASVIAVPILVPESKLFWTLCAFTASTELLLGVICLVTGGTWFGIAGSAVLFGLAVCFLPWAIRAKPLRKWIGNRSKVLIVICADALLFLNMMTMIMLHAGGANRFWPTVGVTAGITLGVLYVMKNRRDEK